MSTQTSRTRRAAVTSAALAGLLIAGLTACSAAPLPAATASNSAASQPLFSSDAEALAAATAAYSKYLEVSDQIARDGGANPERLKPFVSPALLDQQVKEYQAIKTRALHASGESTFSPLRLQSQSNGQMTAYSCLDVSALRVLDLQGADVTPESRASNLPLALTFSKSLIGGVLVESSDVWTGKNFCS